MRQLSAPLRLRPVRRLLFAYGVNALGTWLGEIALAVLVLRETGSAAAVAAVWILGQFVPALVVPALVAKTESLPSRVAIPALLTAEAAIFGLLAIGMAHLPLGGVLLLIGLDGVMAITARALLKASLIATTSPAGLLREGNALLTILFTICMATGPFAAGALVALLSPAATLAVDAGSFLLAAGALGLRSRLSDPHAADTGLAKRLRAGLAHLRGQRRLRRLLIGYALAILFSSAVIPVEVIFVTDTLGDSEAAYGAVLGLWGVGSVVGGAVVPLLRRVPLNGLLVASFLVVGVSYLGMGAASSIEMVYAFSLLGGIANGVEAFAAMTAIQEQTADEFQVRVSGFTEALVAASAGAGFGLGGALASIGSARAVYFVAGVAVAAAAATLTGAAGSCMKTLGGSN
jgi:transmembrane secretion effector